MAFGFISQVRPFNEKLKFGTISYSQSLKKGIKNIRKRNIYLGKGKKPESSGGGTVKSTGEGKKADVKKGKCIVDC